MLIFPEPEKTAILLQVLVAVATDLISVPVKSSPVDELEADVSTFPKML